MELKTLAGIRVCKSASRESVFLVRSLHSVGRLANLGPRGWDCPRRVRVESSRAVAQLEARCIWSLERDGSCCKEEPNGGRDKSEPAEELSREPAVVPCLDTRQRQCRKSLSSPSWSFLLNRGLGCTECHRRTTIPSTRAFASCAGKRQCLRPEVCLRWVDGHAE